MTRTAQNRNPFEDPLGYLPRKPVQEFTKGRIIYDAQQPNAHLYVVILGRVKISHTADDGCQTIGRIARAEGMFGEAALLGLNKRMESAIALDKVTVMSWSRAEIEQYVERDPRLGLALSQYMVRQCIELQDRIESMAVNKTPERVMLALLQLADDLGVLQSDGALRVGPLTHQTIAEFVGTSREIVTFQMNQMRKLGLINYNRKYIDVYMQPIKETLREQGITVPQGMQPMAAVS